VEILLLHPGALGDIILSLPAVALLREKLPYARVTFAASIDHVASIVSGYADRVLSLSLLPLHHLFTGSEVSPEDVGFWKSFDRIVSWTGAGNPVFASNFRMIHPDVCVAPWRPGPGECRHVSRLFADSLGFSACDLSAARINLDAGLLHEGGQWLAAHGWNGTEPLTALHPGAGSAAKRWPFSRFLELARHLALREKRKLLIVGGPAEPGIAEQISKELPVSQIITAESLPLNLLATVLSRCKNFVGNDSGIAHLGAALDLNCIVLFGPTLPQHWAPFSPKLAVLRNTHGCYACASGGTNHTCLSNITVDEVIRALSF
jgi:heptosyltransferase III